MTIKPKKTVSNISEADPKMPKEFPRRYDKNPQGTGFIINNCIRSEFFSEKTAISTVSEMRIETKFFKLLS